MRTTRFAVPALVVALLAGCTATGNRAPRSSQDLLTRADLEASLQANAYEAIRQARPNWLRVRGPNSIYANNPILVYVDGTRSGGVEALQSIPVMAIERMRYYDGTEAQARFGLNHTNGAIEVVTRRGT